MGTLASETTFGVVGEFQNAVTVAVEILAFVFLLQNTSEGSISFACIKDIYIRLRVACIFAEYKNCWVNSHKDIMGTTRFN
jgi:hypothetical protein